MLETKQLSFSKGKKVLLFPTSLFFEPGLHILVGPNGSGKSTFLKTVCGLNLATSGKVLWHGSDLLQKSRQEISKTITLVSQNLEPLFGYTVEEFISMGRYMWGNTDQEMILRALYRTNAQTLLKRPITELSLGERQRVYLARALITEAPLLLLDEPGNHLDIRYQQELWDLLKELTQEKKTVIAISHDLAATKAHADRVYLWQEGNCIKRGHPEEVLTPQAIQHTFKLKL